MKVEGLSSPPASPARSLSSLFPGQFTAELGPTDSPASMASLASGAVAQAPGSYPHLASGQGQPQTNGGSEVNMQEHLQQQVKRVCISF